jgi:hypothetical protein
MANKFSAYLGDFLSGYLNPKGNLADYQHAARLYIDDTFRLAPKNKFLYYVVFNLNPNAIDSIEFQDRHALELNYLVKSMDLPKYTLNTETLNQYNRKTNVYTKIVYDPITLTMHDDNNGITNMLWALYYGYYFNDRNNGSDIYDSISPAAYQRNTYKSKNRFPYRYGLDTEGPNGLSGTSAPFFDSIQLFTLSRQRFFSYLLCNPKITKWDHDNMDQSDGAGIVENKMTLAYDAVIYNSGMVDVDDPAGFAVLHYDNTPSPIASDETLINGMEGIFGDLFSLNSFGSMFSNRGGNGINYYDNIGNRSPYGYGTPDFYGNGNGYYPYSTSGFQNYGFGNTNLKTGLVVAGIGIAGNLVGNVLKNVFSPSASKSDANNAAQTGVATPDNPSGAAKSANNNGGDKAAVETAKEQQATAEAKLIKTQDELAAAQKTEKEATDKFNDSTAKAGEQQKTIDAAQGKIDEAEASKAEANSEIDRLNRKQADLDGKLANGEISLETYNRQTQITNQVKDTFQEQANNADKTISDSQKSINEATILKSNYQNSADEAFNAVTDARQQAAKLDQQQIADAKALDAAEQGVAAAQNAPSTDAYATGGSDNGSSNAANVDTTSTSIYDPESGMSYPNPNYSPDSSRAGGFAAERSVGLGAEQGPPMPSYGRQSEGAMTEYNRRSSESYIESSQFNGGSYGSREDRGTGDAVNSVGENQQMIDDAASYDQGNLATETNDTQYDAASYDQGSGSISDYGEPSYQGDVVSGYDSTGFI